MGTTESTTTQKQSVLEAMTAKRKAAAAIQRALEPLTDAQKRDVISEFADAISEE